MDVITYPWFHVSPFDRINRNIRYCWKVYIDKHCRLVYIATKHANNPNSVCFKCVSSIGRFLEPPFRSQEPFPLPPAILDDVTSVSGSGNGSWLLNGGSKNLPVFRLSGHMYIGMSPLAQVDQIPWPGDRQTVECGQHLGTWWRVCHFFFFFFFF